MTRGPQSTTGVLRSALAGHSEVFASLQVMHDAAWTAIDADLLDLCRVRVAMLLGHDESLTAPDLAPELVAALPLWPTSPLFTPVQRACLAFTEQFVIDVASMDDATVAAVSAELGTQGVTDFANALLVVEQRQRMHLAWHRLIPDVVG